jgi:predicted secreted protein
MNWLVVLSLSLSLLSTAAAAEQKPINVATGHEFKIALDSNPSTGNQWLIARPLDGNLLKLLGTEYKRGRPGADGGAGHEVLSFKALGEGKTQIHLKYGRLFERDDGPTRTTNFVVVITKEVSGQP